MRERIGPATSSRVNPPAVPFLDIDRMAEHAAPWIGDRRVPADRAEVAPGVASFGSPVVGSRRIGRPAPDPVVDHQALLARVAAALASPLDLKDVLQLLSDITRETTGADRCSIFLLEGHQLYPAVAVGRMSSPDDWAAFVAMNPVDIDRERARPFLAGRAVAVEDALTTDVIPRRWVDTFQLRAVVLAALWPAGTPCGLMTLDWMEPRTFSAAELGVIETLATYIGMAVANARPFETVRRRARLQTALARGAAALASTLDPPEIVERLAGAYRELLGARMCAIGLVDLDRSVMTSVAAGVSREIAPIPLTDIPQRIVDALGVAWADAIRPVEIGDEPWLDDLLGAHDVGVTCYVLLPLLSNGRANGGVVLGFDQRTSLDDEEQAAAEALATIAAAALERHELLGRLSDQLRRLDALYQVSAALAEGGNAADLVAGLNNLLESHGVQVVGVTFRDPKLTRHLGGDRPTTEERATWRANNGCVDLPDGSLAVPMRLGRRLVGTLRVRPSDLAGPQRAFLEALATGLAEVASRGALRAEVEQAERQRAIENERDRMAADLHDTAGQLFVALGLLAGRLQEQLPDDSPLVDQARRVVQLADRGKKQIDQAVRALTFLPAAQRGVVPAVRALARAVAIDSGLRVSVNVHGRVERMPARAEQALYRVAHEALTNAWRHAHGREVHVELTFGADDVRLRVADDGVGLEHSTSGDGLHVGILSMQRTMCEAGGTLQFACADAGGGDATGTVVEARLPKEARES